VAALLAEWDDAALEAIAADNLFLDEPLPRRRAAIAGLRSGLGGCAMAPLHAENALRGRFRMDCAAGWLDVALTLAPTVPPRVQHLRVTGGRTPSTAMRDAAAAVLETFNQGTPPLPLAPGVDRAALGALLALHHERHGACALGAPLDGDGVKVGQQIYM
jgi:hypothetical protein